MGFLLLFGRRLLVVHSSQEKRPVFPHVVTVCSSAATKKKKTLKEMRGKELKEDEAQTSTRSLQPFKCYISGGVRRRQKFTKLGLVVSAGLDDDPLRCERDAHKPSIGPDSEPVVFWGGGGGCRRVPCPVRGAV